MGNDIFSAFIDKSKNMILEYANTFFKYTINNKNKITKTLSNIIDIYIDNYYLRINNDFEEVEELFSVQKSKDLLLRKTLSSTVQFYRLNNLNDKIESDKATIILISNVIYLGICLSDKCFKHYIGEADVIVEQFVNKYHTKIRIKNYEEYDEMLESLISITKKNMHSLKKAFKLFDGTNYAIQVKKIMDYDNKYLVEPIYDIKLLSKYSDNEIDSAIDKNIILEHSIISLERTILKVVYDFLKGIHNTQYFLEMPIEIFERQKYSKILSEIFKIECIKKNVVVVLKHDDIVEDKDTIASLKRQNYVLALNHIDILKVNEQSFTNFDYLFVNQQFLETHEGYQEIWGAQGINFIIS